MKTEFDIKKIKIFWGKLFFSITENVFLSCLALFLLALIIGGIMLYKTAFFLKSEPNNIDSLKLEKGEYENILKSWEKEEKKNKESEKKEYNKIFYNYSSPATPDKEAME